MAGLKFIDDIVNNAIANKDLVVVDQEYPGVRITSAQQKDTFKKILEQQISIKYDMGFYNSKKFIKGNGETSYDDLVLAQENMDHTNAQKVAMQTVAQKLLPLEVKADKSLYTKGSSVVLGKMIFSQCLDDHLKASVLNLMNLQYGFNNRPLEKEELISSTAALLIYVQKNNPPLFKSLHESLKRNPNESEVGVILDEVANPNTITVNSLYNFDNNFVKEHYPKDWMQLSDIHEKGKKTIRQFS